MAYRILRNESAESEIRRVLLEQTTQARRLLASWHKEPAARIHRARQTFKRIRAALRALRPAAPYVYSVENRFYRDVARRLSHLRDADAMVEATRVLADRVWEPRSRESLIILQRGLRQHASADVHNSMTSIQDQIGLACAELRKAESRMARLPIEGLRRRDLKAGARRSFDRAARDYRLVTESPGSELFHDWRKHVKYAYYQTRLMRQVMPRWSRQYRSSFRELAQLLGHGQDLVVLDAFLRDQPDDLGIDLHLQRLRNVIQDAERDLRQRALALGAQAFDGDAVSTNQVVPLEARRARR